MSWIDNGIRQGRCTPIRFFGLTLRFLFVSPHFLSADWSCNQVIYTFTFSVLLFIPDDSGWFSAWDAVDGSCVSSYEEEKLHQARQNGVSSCCFTPLFLLLRSWKGERVRERVRLDSNPSLPSPVSARSSEVQQEGYFSVDENCLAGEGWFLCVRLDILVSIVRKAILEGSYVAVGLVTLLRRR